MIVKLPTEYHFESLSLKGGCRGLSESTHVKMPHCWNLMHWQYISYDKTSVLLCILQIYSGADVRTSLAHDANRFAVVNRDFRLLMRATEKNPNVLQCCSRKSKLYHLKLTPFFLMINFLNLYVVETPKWILWHFIRVCTVCLSKIDLHRKKYDIFGEIITRDFSIYTMDYPDLTVSNFMESYIGTKRVEYILIQ